MSKVTKCRLTLEFDIEMEGIDSVGEMQWRVIQAVCDNIDNYTWDVVDDWPFIQLEVPEYKYKMNKETPPWKM